MHLFFYGYFIFIKAFKGGVFLINNRLFNFFVIFNSYIYFLVIFFFKNMSLIFKRSYFIFYYGFQEFFNFNLVVTMLKQILCFIELYPKYKW